MALVVSHDDLGDKVLQRQTHWSPTTNDKASVAGPHTPRFPRPTTFSVRNR